MFCSKYSNISIRISMRYLCLVINILLNIARLNKQSSLIAHNLKFQQAYESYRRLQKIQIDLKKDIFKMGDAVLDIDGSVLEGGGQILRISLALSALTKTPIRIRNIRAGREKPGLMEQHLKGFELIQKLTMAKVRGDRKGSTEIEFYPNQLQSGSFDSVVKTAGSVSLLLQVALPCCLFAPDAVNLRLEGGTNADMAPQIEYITEVFRPNLEKTGASFDFDLIKRGYFPRGGGSIRVDVNPIKHLAPVNLEEMGEIAAIYGWCFSAGRSQIQEAEEMAAAARDPLQTFHANVDIEVYHEDKKIAPIGDCAGIILVAETSAGCYLGGSSLKKRNEAPRDAGKRAAEELAESLRRRVCVDDHSQDQLIVFMALAKGKSRIKVGNVTMHTRTAIHVVQLFTAAKFAIRDYSEYSIIECEGIGLERAAPS